MKNIKILFAFVVILSILTIASCTDKTDNSTTDDSLSDVSTSNSVIETKPVDEETTKISEVINIDDIELDDIINANKISAILDNHTSVTVSVEYNGAKQTDSFIKTDFGSVAIFAWENFTGTKLIDGYVNDLSFSVEDGVNKVSKNIASFAEDGLLFEQAIITHFENKEIGKIIDDGDNVILEMTYPEISEFEQCLFTIDKQTYELKQIHIIFDDNNKENYMSRLYSFSYDGEFEDYGIIDAFEKDTREIELICDIFDNGQNNHLQFTVNVPNDWELYPTGYSDLSIFMDKDYSVAYEYPGSGEGYTLYITNSMG